MLVICLFWTLWDPLVTERNFLLLLLFFFKDNDSTELVEFRSGNTWAFKCANLSLFLCVKGYVMLWIPFYVLFSFNGIFLYLNYIAGSRKIHSCSPDYAEYCYTMSESQSKYFICWFIWFCLWPLCGDFEIFISFSLIILFYFFLQLKCSKMDPFELGWWWIDYFICQDLEASWTGMPDLKILCFYGVLAWA